ncbi:TPA: terminase [Streptococcus suis]|nr:terminase [Streptococcus suis]
MARKKLGNQNPSQSVILKYVKKHSKAHEAVDIYQRTGLACYAWQVNLLTHVMAVDKHGLWVHQKFGYSIPRRNGKSEILYMLELWGLEQGINMLHTAHRISTSHSSFEKVKRYLEKMGYVDGEDFNSIRAKGQERIELYKSGGVVQFRTRTSSGGLGEGFDLLIIDEAQEYTTEQESALKYTVTDSDNPMTVMCGTPPTPVSSGTVFTKYREACLFGKSKYSGWAEWSVDSEREIDDVAAWYNSNPSMGYHLNERKIEAELGEDKLDHNVQRLGFWPTYNQKSVISETDWESLKVEAAPVFTGKLFAGIKYGQDGTNVALSVAVRTKDERVFVETIDCQSVRNGNMWLVEFLKSADLAQVVIDGASGQRILEEELKAAKVKGLVLPTVKEIINANALFEQGVYQKTLCHNGQPSLQRVVTNCDKRNIGSNGGFGYRSHFDDMDISLMDSALLAHWACVTTKPKKKQRISY